MPTQFYLSAAHKSSGKTMISLGLCAAFTQLGNKVQSFKKGLDYIDPIWLSMASQNPCYNLDFYTMNEAEILAAYQNYCQKSDVCIVEGNKGLFDGMTTLGGDCNADLANLLGLPVILVVDVSGITRGIAPLLIGYQNFDHTNIAGVILNKVASNRHQSKLIDAIQTYTNLTVFGSVHRDNKLFIKERYLGLKPANEDYKPNEKIQKIGQRITDSVNLSALLELNTPHTQQITTAKIITVKHQYKIAVAKDKAFGFYYADDLAAFAKQGVELVYFDTLKDGHLPEADGLLIGGGFPEIYAQELSENTNLLSDIKQKIQSGLPTYAECGGLMYLSRCIITQQSWFNMVGVIEADTQMHDKPMGRGYVQLQKNNQHLWQTETKAVVNAHEFHYSKLINISPDTKYGYDIKRGVGIDKQKDGIIIHNLLASYTHLKNNKQNNWVKHFSDFVKKCVKY